MKWTKCIHKCPDTDRDVLVYCPSYKKTIDIAKYSYIPWMGKKGFWRDENFDHVDEIMFEPTHWAELPKKPE